MENTKNIETLLFIAVDTS